MRVLVHQQFHLGHHYSYLSHLLPGLSQVVDDVIVAVTSEGLHSEEFRTFLAPLNRTVAFDASLPLADPRLLMSERWRVHRELRAAVRRTAPDYVLIPSGDSQATAMAAFRVAGLGALPGHKPCEVGIHFGQGSCHGQSVKTVVRDRLNESNLAASRVERVHLVNFLFHEQVQHHGGPFAARTTVMPHPVPKNPRLSKVESRRHLGIPEEGRYVGLAASIDSRKAIPQFLAAFRAAARPSDRLLLVGWINGTHLRVIRQEFADLVAHRQVILIEGFQSMNTFQTALSALDVVCTPYPAFGGVSSTLLEGVAAGRPVLAHDFGWSAEIIRRFGFGWTCDVLNHQQFAATLRTALDRADAYRESASTSRLLAFHSPENFAESWLELLRVICDRPSPRRPILWGDIQPKNGDDASQANRSSRYAGA